MNTTPGSRDILVSTIVPCFQAEHVVEGAIRSALAQTHRRHEVIVIDDGSTDGTLQRVGEIHDARLRVFSQRNAGTASARNLGLAHARGEYIAFLDADDRWFPEKLATELETLLRQRDPRGAAYSWFFAVDDGGRLLNSSRRVTHEGDILEALLDEECFLIPTTSLYHRDVFETIGAFDPTHFHEDHEFALRAARGFRFYPTRRRLAVYRQSLSGKCRSLLSSYDRAYREELSLVDTMRPLLGPEQLRRLRQNQIRSLFFRFLMYGFDDSARRLAPEVDVAALRGRKGHLAKLYLRTGINLFPAVRRTVQAFTGVTRGRRWTPFVLRRGVALAYE